MKGKAILLATLMIVSMAVAGVGGASAASATDPVQESTHQPVQPQENATNATPQASGSDGSEDTDLPEAVDVPPNQLKNGSVDPASIPSSFEKAKSGGYSVGSADKGASKSVRRSSYNPSPKELTWFGYDSTGQAGNGYPYYAKNYTLKAVSDHAEVWVANDISFADGDTTNRSTPTVSDRQATYLASQFESNIYPNESRIFRKPDFRNGENGTIYNNTGAVVGKQFPDDYFETEDNSSRTVLLVDNIRDENYYDSNYPVYTAGLSSPSIDDFTDRNVAFIDAANWDRRLGGPDAPWKPDEGETLDSAVEGTTAHEYQHILHSDADANEESWIQEGFSDYAIYATGYGIDMGHVNAYESNPENSLTTWSDEGNTNILRDYGGAFLFQLYLQEQYGTDFLKAEFNSEKNGIQGVEEALDQAGADRNFYQLYQDFQTMLVTDGKDTSADGRYQLNTVDLNVNTNHSVHYTENNTTAAWGNAFNPLSPKSGSVDSLNVSGVNFPGSTPWSSVEDPTGDTDHEVLYSGKGNGLDNFAIFDADLSDTDSPTLSFDTNYDIERGWDYGFVQVSTDGGDTWQSLSNDDTTSYKANPGSIDQTVEENLPGFTGSSDGWTNEQFDLSQYAGQDVLVAFRYVTDSASINPGFYVRDISVSGTDIDYDGSSTEPFQSLREAQQNYLRYEFSLIGVDDDGSTGVQQYDPTEFPDSGSVSVDSLLDGDYDRTILAASRAPNPEDSGVVPYGYDVNAGDGSEPSDGAHTITFVGSGDRSEYTFSVTDDLEKSTANGANINDNDEVRRGYAGAGQVGISRDSYTYNGTLETIDVNDDVTVLVDGEQLGDDVDDMRDNVIEIAGTGDAANYDFASTDGGTARLQKVTANNANINGNDEIFRTTGNGQVGISKDAYGFDGTIDSLDLNGGDANVYVNGRQVDPANEQDNMITIVGTGDAANYEFTTTGSIAPSTANYANTNSNDVISGMTKTGIVGISSDSNDYNGDITDFSASGDVQVYIDGQQIDQDDVASQA